MQSKNNKQNVICHEKFTGGKVVSPAEMLCLLRKNEYNRMWILKQLSQLGINVDILEQYSLNELYKHCGKLIRSTYSIKYLGLNENEMGIISRRIDPNKQNNFPFADLPQTPYMVNKFFFPKPLKLGKKPKKEGQINLNNLQNEIKKAFVVTKQSPSQPQKKLKTAIHGSWISSSSQMMDGKTQCDKSKSHPYLKHLDKNFQQIQEFQNQHQKKMPQSYSRFLNSEFVFSAIDTLN